MYEATEKHYKGNPVIEILDDGEPFGADLPTKEHFSFGVRKAQMVVAFMDEIARFARSDGAEPSITREIERDVRGVGSCTCVKETEFEVHGDTIERPYLELSAGSRTIGFGVTKAEALLDVEEDLERFVEKYA